jgi:hypothetical protein
MKVTMKMKMTGFWDIAPCSLVEVDRCFRGAFCLSLQGGKVDWCFRGSYILSNQGQ